MPLTMAEFEKLAAQKPPDTPLTEILGVGDVYWSASLVNHIYVVPDVMGKPAAIIPVGRKSRFKA